MNFEREYLWIVDYIINNGKPVPSRAGYTWSVVGVQFRIGCLTSGFFPLLTTRKMYYKSVLGELAAFLRGATTLAEFKAFGCNYWDANAAAWPANSKRKPEDYEVGRIYGAQWVNWAYSVNQLDKLVAGIKRDPFSRRHIVTAWAPHELDEMCLPPCHIFFQCFVREDKLSMTVYMRSVDMCLGLPADVVLYATLLLLLCNETALEPGELVFMCGDAHVYRNHVDAALEQIQRKVLAPPRYKLSHTATLKNFVPDHLEISNYNCKEAINYELNV